MNTSLCGIGLRRHAQNAMVSHLLMWDISSAARHVAGNAAVVLNMMSADKLRLRMALQALRAVILGALFRGRPEMRIVAGDASETIAAGTFAGAYHQRFHLTDGTFAGHRHAFVHEIRKVIRNEIARTEIENAALRVLETALAF